MSILYTVVFKFRGDPIGEESFLTYDPLPTSSWGVTKTLSDGAKFYVDGADLLWRDSEPVKWVPITSAIRLSEHEKLRNKSALAMKAALLRQSSDKMIRDADIYIDRLMDKEIESQKWRVRRKDS